MTTIYIGTAFKELRLTPKGSFSFENDLYVVLFNKQSRTYYPADGITEAENGSYDIDWSEEVTKQMSTGVYTLEVYEIVDNKKSMLYRKKDYATAVIVAVSPGQDSGITPSNE